MASKCYILTLGGPWENLSHIWKVFVRVGILVLKYPPLNHQRSGPLVWWKKNFVFSKFFGNKCDGKCPADPKTGWVSSLGSPLEKLRHIWKVFVTTNFHVVSPTLTHPCYKWPQNVIFWLLEVPGKIWVTFEKFSSGWVF